MYKNIKVEGENLELILENSHGDKAIIPANKRDWVKQKLSEGCHNCIDSLVETLPVASQYAQDGSVYPPNKKVKVNQDNQIKEYDISSPEYKDLYNSGKLTTYDKNTDSYIATPLKEVTITAERPQWAKDKMQFEKEYTKDMFIDESMPKWSRSMGISATNMNPNNIAEYDKRINDKVVENIFKRKPTFDTDYSNDRLKTLQGFTQKELELIKNSKYASKIEPSIWSKFEQGLLSVGNAGSPVTFKNENLTQEEAKKEDNPLNILQPLNIPSKMVQSAYKKDYSLKDALKGKQNNAGIVEDIVTDPLNLVGIGLAGKLSKVDKAIDATKAGSKVLNKEARLNKLTELELLSEKEIAQKRADRLLAQKDKWIGQDDKILEGQLKNAGKNHESNLTAQEFNIKYNSSKSPSNIGINKEGKTFIFKDAPLTELNKKRVAAHEVGHYYRNTLEEGLEWDKYFDFTETSFKEKKYLRGKGLTGNGSVKGDELRERAAQLKDFIAVKNNIPLDKDFVITPSQFDDALKNYVKETGLNNNMETFIKAIKDKKGLLKEMNKKALGIIPAALYLQSQQQNKSEQ